MYLDVDSLNDEERSNLESKIHSLNNTNLDMKVNLAKIGQQEKVGKVEIQRLKIFLLDIEVPCFSSA